MKKLIVALSNRTMTDFQRTKIFDNNFDVLIGQPLLDQFLMEGNTLTRGPYQQAQTGNLTLPIPPPTAQSLLAESQTEQKTSDNPTTLFEEEDTETMSSFMFPK